MTTTANATSSLTLPRPVRLADGTDITLRLLGVEDIDAFLTFTTSLPEHDLLFLRTDITNPGIVVRWAAGQVTSAARRHSVEPFRHQLERVKVLRRGSLHCKLSWTLSAPATRGRSSS